MNIKDAEKEVDKILSIVDKNGNGNIDFTGSSVYNIKY